MTRILSLVRVLGLTRSLTRVLWALALALEGELEGVVGLGLGGLAVGGGLFVLLRGGRWARGFVGELALAPEIAFYHATGNG